MPYNRGMKRVRLPALLFLTFLLLTCVTEEMTTAPVATANPDAWKEPFRGQTVYVITQGTVGVDVTDMLQTQIPQAKWVARFDYDPDRSGNYLVLDFQSERSGTPIAPVVGRMFSSQPLSGTLQVFSNRIRLGYFEAPLFEGWNGELEHDLKAYAGFIKGSAIQETQGPWFADPLTSFARKSVDKRNGDTSLTAVNYYTGEEKNLLTYQILPGAGRSGDIPWKLVITDSCGELEWVSGLVSGDERAGVGLTGFYGAVEGGRLEFSGTYRRSPTFRELQLSQADIEFSNGLMITWVAGRALRLAYPNTRSTARIERGPGNEQIVWGEDFSGNPIKLFRIDLDPNKGGPYLETYRKIRSLELPLRFNGREERSYTFANLRSDFIQEIDPPSASPRSVSIDPIGTDRGFIDLPDGLFFSLTEPETLPPEWTGEENRLILISNNLPYGSLEFISELISFYPELRILSVDTDLTVKESGDTEYALILETSPQQAGVTYQVSIQPHPSLFEQGYVWEFTGRD